MKGRERTVLEQRRVRAARLTILAVCAFLVMLALWQCAENMVGQEGRGLIPQFAQAQIGATNPVPPAPPSVREPLGIEQAGIVFKDSNEEGSILWYQSSWNVEQSRTLVERSLILQGWLNMSTEDEQVMSFLYAPHAHSNGATLIVSFYPLQEGCTILVETL